MYIYKCIYRYIERDYRVYIGVYIGITGCILGLYRGIYRDYTLNPMTYHTQLSTTQVPKALKPRHIGTELHASI